MSVPSQDNYLRPRPVGFHRGRSSSDVFLYYADDGERIPIKFMDAVVEARIGEIPVLRLSIDIVRATVESPLLQDDAK